MAQKKDHLEHLREIRVKKKRPPQSFAELAGDKSINKLLRKKGRIDRIRSAWFAVCGSLLCEHSDVKSFRAGELRITCTSQALASELSTHRHQEMLGKINQELAERDRVARMIFRAGRA